MGQNNQSLFFDPNDTELMSKVAALDKVPGYCILVDIVGSTKLKDEFPKKEWLERIYNTFDTVRSYLRFAPLKYIGDAIMYYYPEDGVKNAESLMRLLMKVFKDNESSEKKKAVITYVTDVYSISFMNGANDYYGKGIDFSFRLLNSLANENEIIFNHTLFKQLSTRFKEENIGNLFGPWPVPLKGFKNQRRIHKWRYTQTKRKSPPSSSAGKRSKT
jgi:hypothetical protein